MTLAELLPHAIHASLFLAVVAVGLTATVRDSMLLFRQPAQLARLVLAMYVVMLGVAIVIALAIDLPPVGKIALGALAVSPVPPIISGKALKAGGEASYTTGVLVAGPLLAIVFLPLAVIVCHWIFGLPLPIKEVIRQVATSVLLPLAAGMAARQLVPALARLAKPLAMLATLLLVVSFVPVLLGKWQVIEPLIGGGLVLAFAAFAVAGLAAGHLIGGPRPDERAVLAIASANRHPALAIAIAHASFPNHRLAAPAVLLYLIVAGIVSLPYSRWSARAASRAKREVIDLSPQGAARGRGEGLD
jgi:BASS family bile acid:Na+ symporter